MFLRTFLTKLQKGVKCMLHFILLFQLLCIYNMSDALEGVSGSWMVNQLMTPELGPALVQHLGQSLQLMVWCQQWLQFQLLALSHFMKCYILEIIRSPPFSTFHCECVSTNPDWYNHIEISHFGYISLCDHFNHKCIFLFVLIPSPHPVRGWQPLS